MRTLHVMALQSEQKQRFLALHYTDDLGDLGFGKGLDGCEGYGESGSRVARTHALLGATQRRLQLLEGPVWHAEMDDGHSKAAIIVIVCVGCEAFDVIEEASDTADLFDELPVGRRREPDPAQAPNDQLCQLQHCGNAGDQTQGVHYSSGYL